MGEIMNILEEANQVTSGDRRASYGHPLDNNNRVVTLWNAWLKSCGVALYDLDENGKPEAPTEFAEEDVADMMILFKMARDMNKAKRDNLVDICGYAWTKQEIREERERRNGNGTH